MKSVMSIVAVVAMVLAFVAMLSSQGATQSNQASRAWSYAYVMEYPPAVVYAEADGCRVENTPVDPAPPRGLAGCCFGENRHRAMAKTRRMLGDDGWEMVGSGHALQAGALDRTT